MLLGLICTVLCLVCVGVCVYGYAKNDKLIKETHSAKKEYLNAKSMNIRLESHYVDAVRTLKEANLLNREMIEEMKGLRVKVDDLSGLVVELDQRVVYLEDENKMLRQKLHIRDEVSSHCKVVRPFKMTI